MLLNMVRVIAFVMAGTTVTTSASYAGGEILFGIVPQQSATRLAKMWIPVMNRLAQETGLKIRFATTRDIPTFEKCLAKGAYELAYMNPYHYTVFHETSGYRAFVREEGKRLQGLIVVKADSPANDLADLDGQTLAFPSPAAFAASVLPRAELRARKITFEAKYVKSHDSVYRAVAAGHYAAGGGVKRTFNSIPTDIRAQLRVIYTTKGSTPHAFAALPSLPAAQMAQISQAMLTTIGKDATLMKLVGMKGLEAASDTDWNDIRALGLTSANTQIADQGAVKCRSD